MRHSKTCNTATTQSVPGVEVHVYWKKHDMSVDGKS